MTQTGRKKLFEEVSERLKEQEALLLDKMSQAAIKQAKKQLKIS